MNSFTLTNGSSKSPPGYYINLTISFTDMNELKSRSLLATTSNNTFLSLTAATIDDIYSLNIIAIPPIEAIPVTEVFPDIIPPEMVEFSLDLNTEILNLTFSEIVYVSNLDISQLFLLPTSPSDVTDIFSLTGAFTENSLYSRIISVELSDSDLNGIKLNTQFATSQFNTFCSISESLISDTSLNHVLSIPIFSPLNVSSYVSDMKSPVLSEYSFDLNMGLMHLTFNEIINASSINLTELILTNLAGDKYRLTSGSSSMVVSNLCILSIHLPTLTCIANFS